MFATLFFGVLDSSSGQLFYVNAGHEPVCVIGRNGIRKLLTATGPAVGIIPDAVRVPRQLQLEPGDTLFGYTDGVTEARSPSDEMYTRDQLQALIGRVPVHTAEKLLQSVRSDLFAFINNAPQSDDITMLAARWEQGL
jgi:sigma-B regulation protein RsbU (phosphoserine phosphatase)